MSLFIVEPFMLEDLEKQKYVFYCDEEGSIKIV